MILIPQDRNTINTYKKEYEKSPFKIWYELASDKSLQQLSKEFYTGVEYFSNYDELSNWIHPQRLEENLNVEGYIQNLPNEYYNLLIGSLIWEVNNLVDNLKFIVKKFNIVESNSLFRYGDNISKFFKKLQTLLISIPINDH